MTVSAASPTLDHHPQPGRGHAGHGAGDAERHGGPGERLSPDRHHHLHAVQRRAARTVDTETVTVSGNGTYTTPTGFTLPTTGTVDGNLPVERHLQRRQQQQRRQRQRRRQRAGDGQRRQPDGRDHRQPDRDDHAGHDVADAERHGRGGRRLQPDRHAAVHAEAGRHHGVHAERHGHRQRHATRRRGSPCPRRGP